MPIFLLLGTSVGDGLKFRTSTFSHFSFCQLVHRWLINDVPPHDDMLRGDALARLAIVVRLINDVLRLVVLAFLDAISVIVRRL